MLDDFYPSDEYETDGWEAGLTFSQPNDVVRDPSLTTAQKRAILASWASDARAVADAPSRRQLDDGTMLDIDDILDALKQLDREQGAVRTSPLKVKSRLRHRRAFRGALRYSEALEHHQYPDEPRRDRALAALVATDGDGDRIVVALVSENATELDR